MTSTTSIGRVILVVTLVFTAGCELFAPPPGSRFGDVCGPDRACSSTTVCIDGLCVTNDVDADGGDADGGDTVTDAG